MGISHMLFPKILRLSYGGTLQENQLIILRFLYFLIGVQDILSLIWEKAGCT